MAACTLFSREAPAGCHGLCWRDRGLCASDRRLPAPLHRRYQTVLTPAVFENACFPRLLSQQIFLSASCTILGTRETAEITSE